MALKFIPENKEEAENLIELAPWQKQIIDERLNDYYNNPEDVADFDKNLDAIEKEVV
jgi:hypothetical protein